MAANYEALTCNSMEISGPIKVTTDGAVIENKIIVVDPTLEGSTKNDFALKIVANNVTVRNVPIYHASNGMGIYGFKANGLVLDNVEVIAYGNAWGAQACPSRRPFSGFDCSNIKIVRSEDVMIDNVRVKNGSRGISLVRSPRSTLTNVVSINPRGPQPGG